MSTYLQETKPSVSQVMEENPIKRERLRKEQRKRMTEEMRAALPVYDMEEIRNYRLAFHEALLTTLSDRGYQYSVEYLKHLIQFQDDFRQTAGPTSPVWTRPQLSQSKKELQLLSEYLCHAEDCHNEGNYASECEEVIQAAVHFAFSEECWWWLGEQLLISCLMVCSQYAFLDERYEALTRYCYGKFLVENFKEDEPAMEHLEIARRLSNGKDWTTKLVAPTEPDILFLKANYYLCMCLIRQVEDLMQTDYIQAGRLAIVAKKRAAEACYKEGEIRALMLKGLCQLSCNNTKGALASFTKTYYIQLRIGSQKGLCETRIHLARAHMMDGNPLRSLNTLLLLRETAEEHNLPFYLAQSYRHLGEFFLNRGEAVKATPLLGESRKIFQEFEFVRESDQVRILEAISIGLEHFLQYIKLFKSRSEQEKKEKLARLVEWKDERVLFYEKDDEDTYSVDEIIQESIAGVKGRRFASADMPEEQRAAAAAIATSVLDREDEKIREEEEFEKSEDSDSSF